MSRLFVTYQGRVASENATLGELGVREFGTLVLNLAVCGGAEGKMDPASRELAERYIMNVKICRKCYSRNALRATKCRKKRCGGCTNLRGKKKLKAKVKK